MNTTNYRELAERIYDLDTKVVEALDSSLGRVFTQRREKSCDEIVKLMKARDRGHNLRTSIALIANMARTIGDDNVRTEIMHEYDALLDEVINLPTSFGEGDIVDTERNELNLLKRFNDGDHLIICINKSYGSGGNEIGFNLATRLKINYYDSEIFENVLRRLESEDYESVEDKGGFPVLDATEYSQVIYTEKDINLRQKATLKAKLKSMYRYHGLNKRDAVFFNQSHLLIEMSKTENFVIMDRCADVILRNNNIPHISIFIDAPVEQRIKRISSIHQAMTEDQVRKMIKQMDRRHTSYQKFYTGLEWTDARNYDLYINSSSYGIKGSTDILYNLIHPYFDTPGGMGALTTHEI